MFVYIDWPVTYFRRTDLETFPNSGIPPFLQAEVGTRFSEPGGMQGWVDLCYVKADRLGIELPATCQSQVERPTAAKPRNTRPVHG